MADIDSQPNPFAGQDTGGMSAGEMMGQQQALAMFNDNSGFVPASSAPAQANPGVLPGFVPPSAPGELPGFVPPAGLSPGGTGYWGGLGHALLGSLYKGVGQAGAIASNFETPGTLANPNVGESLQDWARQGEQQQIAQMSPQAQDLLQKGITGQTSLKRGIEALPYSLVSQAVPMAAAAGVGSLVGAGVGAVGGTAAEPGGGTVLGALGGLAGGAAGGAVLGQEAGYDERSQVMGMDVKTLAAQSPQFNQIYDQLTSQGQGANPQDRAEMARYILAGQMGRSVGESNSALLSVLGPAAGKVAGMLGGEGAGGLVGGLVNPGDASILRAAAIEAGTNATLGGAQAAVTAQQEKAVNPQSNPLAAGISGALEGGAFGGMLGAGLGVPHTLGEAANRMISGPEQPAIQAGLEAFQNRQNAGFGPEYQAVRQGIQAQMEKNSAEQTQAQADAAGPLEGAIAAPSTQTQDAQANADAQQAAAAQAAAETPATEGAIAGEQPAAPAQPPLSGATDDKVAQDLNEQTVPENVAAQATAPAATPEAQATEAELSRPYGLLTPEEQAQNAAYGDLLPRFVRNMSDDLTVPERVQNALIGSEFEDQFMHGDGTALGSFPMSVSEKLWNEEYGHELERYVLSPDATMDEHVSAAQKRLDNADAENWPQETKDATAQQIANMKASNLEGDSISAPAEPVAEKTIQTRATSAPMVNPDTAQGAPRNLGEAIAQAPHLQGALDYIAKNSRDPFERYISQKVSAILGSKARDIPVSLSNKMDPFEKGTFTRDKSGNASIKLNNSENVSGLRDQTLLHESLHAAMHEVINDWENGNKTGVRGRLLTDLDSLRKKVIARRGGNAKAGTPDYVHGLSNLHEFVSEFFGNSKFRDFLRQTSEDGKPTKSGLRNAFNRFTSLTSRVIRGENRGIAASKDPVQLLMDRADDLFANPSLSPEIDGRDRSPLGMAKNPDLAEPKGSLFNTLGTIHEDTGSQSYGSMLDALDQHAGNVLPKAFKDNLAAKVLGAHEFLRNDPHFSSVSHALMKVGQPAFLAEAHQGYKKVFRILRDRDLMQGVLGGKLEDHLKTIVAPDSSFPALVRFAMRNIAKTRYVTDKDLQWLAKNAFHDFDSEGRNHRFTDDELRSKGASPRARAAYKEFMSAMDGALDEQFGSEISRAVGSYAGADAQEKLEPLLKAEKWDDAHNQAKAMIDQARDDRVSKIQEELVPLTLRAEAGDSDANDQVSRLNAQVSLEQNNADRLKQALDEGKSQIQTMKDQGFFPAYRFGKHYVLTKSTGNEGFARTHFETRGEALAFARDQQRKGNLLSDEQILKDHGIAKGRLPVGTLDDSASPYSTAANLEQFERLVKGNISDPVEQMSLMNELRRNIIGGANGKLNRMMERRGIQGASDDPRRTIARFVQATARDAAFNRTDARLNDSIEAMSSPEDAPVKAYAKNQDSYLRNPGNEFGKIRSLTSIHYLGWSPASALINIVGSLPATMGFLGQHKSGANPVRVLGDILTHMMPNGEKKLSLDNQAALKQLEERHVLHPVNSNNMQIEAQRSWGDGAGVRALFGSGMMMFQKAEGIGRRMAALGALKAYERMSAQERQEVQAKYKTDGTAAGYAEKVVDMTQGVLSKTNRPQWARGLGAIPYTFQHYPLHMFHLLKSMNNAGRLRMLGTLAALGGAQAMPGVGSLADLIDAVSSWLGHPLQTKDMIQEYANQKVGPGVARALGRGISGLAISPVDFASRMSLADPIPGITALNRYNTDRFGDLLGILGAPFSAAKDYSDAVDQLAKSNYRAAIQKAVPTGVKNVGLAAEEAATGVARNAAGQKLGPVSLLQAAAKGIGLQSSQQEMRSDLATANQGAINIARGQSQAFSRQLLNARLAGDEQKANQVMTEIGRWNQSNPNYRISAIKVSNSARMQYQRAQLQQQLRMLKNAPMLQRQQLVERIKNLDAMIGDKSI